MFIFSYFFCYSCPRNAYQIIGSQNFRGRLRQLFHVLSDDAVNITPVVNVVEDDTEDNAMQVELVASAYADAQAQAQNMPSTPSGSRGPPGTPGTKRKAAEGVGNSSTRTRLQF